YATAPVGFSGEEGERDRDKTMKALSDFLRPEFINRVDEIITFRSLNQDDFKKIAGIMLSDLRDLLEEKGIKFSWDDSAAELVAEKSFSRKFGARNMRRYIQTEIEDRIASLMIEKRGQISVVSVSRDGDSPAVAAM
ncbi:MAG: ATP-dependent Clp protease ATP-binding subunit, partial [Clostridia bacterium]|nr:ATP-dependent Clp protease ATP-binding subunit [Clostridia bacterium]